MQYQFGFRKSLSLQLLQVSFSCARYFCNCGLHRPGGDGPGLIFPEWQQIRPNEDGPGQKTWACADLYTPYGPLSLCNGPVYPYGSRYPLCVYVPRYGPVYPSMGLWTAQWAWYLLLSTGRYVDISQLSVLYRQDKNSSDWWHEQSTNEQSLTQQLLSHTVDTQQLPLSIDCSETHTHIHTYIPGTFFLQCFDTVGWVILTHKTRPRYDL